MSLLGLGRVKTPTFNLRVEIPSRFRKFENQKCLRPLLREDDRENNSAHSWLVHVLRSQGQKRKSRLCGRMQAASRIGYGKADTDQLVDEGLFQRDKEPQ